MNRVCISETGKTSRWKNNKSARQKQIKKVQSNNGSLVLTPTIRENKAIKQNKRHETKNKYNPSRN